MFVFKSTRQRFYLIVGLLLLLFCIAYIQLAGFLGRLSTSAQRVQAATLIDQEIRHLGEQFWKLRFWEQIVQTQSHPEADQQFGVTIEDIRKRIATLNPGPFIEQLAGNTAKISSLLSQYEESFNALIQFGTEQRLNQTQLESNYQVLSSTMLLSQDTDLLKPLLNLDRFLDRYLTTHKDSEYKALRMVFTFLQTTLFRAEMMDERLQSYITKFDTFIERDLSLENEIRLINEKFDQISRELMMLFGEIFQTVAELSQEALSTGEQLQDTIQQRLLISAVVAFVTLLLIVSMIASKIINPIRHMSTVVMQVKAGNDQARFVSREKDEIAELGFVFNDMLDTIHQHRYRLETLVEERTEELIKANEQLHQEISKHKQTELELQQAKEVAEVANKAKSVFLANMSHELRTPLNAIIGFAQIMAHSQNLNPDEQENLHIIGSNGEHLLSLINQVLDLSKIEAGHTVLNETNFDLYHLLDDLEEMFQLRSAAKGLQLSFERSPELLQYVRTDEIRLRQVLLNLLSNAIKFTQKGGVTVRVCSERFSVPERAEALTTNIHFEVEDTGPGIAPDELDSLFEAFVQTKTGQEWQSGTGLGLSISRKFVQLMGGDISVDSQVGQGAVFRFDIWVQRVEADTLAMQQRSRRVIALESAQPRYRILVADDKLSNRQLLIKLLQPLGFSLQEAANGQEALGIWEAWKPHLIWMDIRMPGMDGYEATKRIKAADKGGITTIIALTALSLEDEEVKARSSGCDDFLRKPFYEAEIFDLLHKHLDIQFIYEDDQEQSSSNESLTSANSLTPVTLAGLPLDLLESLEKAVVISDIHKIFSVTNEIHRYNRHAASTLENLANKYDYPQILTLIQKANHEKQTQK